MYRVSNKLKYKTGWRKNFDLYTSNVGSGLLDDYSGGY